MLRISRRSQWSIFSIAPVLAVLALVAPEAPLQAADRSTSISDGDPQGRKRVQARHPASGLGVPRTSNRSTGATKPKDGQRETKAVEGKTATRPLFAVVSIGDQRVSIYNHNGLVARSVVSTGMAGHRTPMGIFTIIGRERFHRSNLYSAAPMPFMQRVTWSGVAMHLGVVPGYPASHGCIRLPPRFAAELWGLTKIGERVVIAPRDAIPREFAHPLLPAPRMQPDPRDSSETASANGGIITGTTATGDATVLVASNGNDAPPAAEPSPTSRKMLNPIAFAAAYKVKAAADSTRAAKAAKVAFETASAKTAEARRAIADLKAAMSARESAESKVASAVKALTEATLETLAAAEAGKAAADAELSAAEGALSEVRAMESQKTADSFAAVQAWKEATAAAASASNETKEAARRASPVSVLISKKDQRVYVRQALEPLLDAPASVRDPDVPLGTHVYIASAAGEDGASLKWSVISMPALSGEREKAAEKNSQKQSREKKAATIDMPRPLASSPAEALERVEIPAEIRERISELLWTGGSLIITDQALSDETSDEGTDLVVTMRQQ